ncbi:exodeoxyribonuclease V, gamma subunit [Mycobacterium xenopi 4042]|uniref:Exodeoxyribonuclease V, gamma subunit n=1 Tax=Mycobacterium xenopi 4042 TaxID=1299334 RepID=X8BLC0_MYCXE|nr:exodeoxyribonuclease V, gamma subunit [Mycobacterium xenopi 4042]
MLTEPQDAWQQACSASSQSVGAGGSRESTVLRLPDVRSLLDTQLAGDRPGELSHRHADGVHDGADALGAASGGVPGRARRRGVSRLLAPDGDDVLARCPMTGERDVRPRTPVAAGRHLRGHRDPGDHVYRRRRALRSRAPPAVPLAELLDALDQTTQAPVREHVVTKHPLQPFDRRNVTPGELVPAHRSPSTPPR